MFCMILKSRSSLTKQIKRYKVKWPFNAEYDFLPDNFNVAKNRPLNLKQKLLKNENLARTYDDILNEYLKKGITEKIDDTNKASKNVHYLPHHSVIKNERATTKTRKVFAHLLNPRMTFVSMTHCILGRAWAVLAASFIWYFITFSYEENWHCCWY